MTSKQFKSLLYQQAVKIVQKREKQEQLKRINQEYQQLLYDSQILRADQKTILKIRKIAQHLPSAHSMGVAALNHTIKGVLDDYIKQKKYHPKSLKEIEEYTKTREWPKFLLTEV